MVVAATTSSVTAALAGLGRRLDEMRANAVIRDGSQSAADEAQPIWIGSPPDQHSALRAPAAWADSALDGAAQRSRALRGAGSPRRAQTGFQGSKKPAPPRLEVAKPRRGENNAEAERKEDAPSASDGVVVPLRPGPRAGAAQRVRRRGGRRASSSSARSCAGSGRRRAERRRGARAVTPVLSPVCGAAGLEEEPAPNMTATTMISISRLAAMSGVCLFVFVASRQSSSDSALRGGVAERAGRARAQALGAGRTRKTRGRRLPRRRPARREGGVTAVHERVVRAAREGEVMYQNARR